MGKKYGWFIFTYSVSIAVDASGNVYTTGYFQGTVDFDPAPGTFNLTSAGGFDIFISKLDALGNFVWAKNMGGPDADESNSIALDPSGNVLITGYFTRIVDFDPGLATYNLTSTTGGFDMFICKLDASGNFIWAKELGSADVDDFGQSIAVDASGNAYIAGKFNGNIAKFDPLGNILWTVSGGRPGNFIKLDASGNIYITGSFSGTADFDPGPGTNNLTSAGGFDIFVVKLNSGNLCTPVSISTQPINQTASVGGTATFSVVPAGTAPFIYFWYKNNVQIQGASSPSYTTPVLSASDNGNSYYCIITNCNRTNQSISNNAILTVNTSCMAPTTQASNISFSSIGANQLTINWTNGSGGRRVVKINTSNSFTSPSDGTDPTANAVYSGGEQVVYNNNGNSAIITGLAANTTYWVRIYDANCSGNSSVYNTSTATNNPNSQSTQSSGATISISSSQIPPWQRVSDAFAGSITVDLSNAGSNPTWHIEADAFNEAGTYVGNINIGMGTNSNTISFNSNSVISYFHQGWHFNWNAVLESNNYAITASPETDIIEGQWVNKNVVYYNIHSNQLMIPLKYIENTNSVTISFSRDNQTEQNGPLGSNLNVNDNIVNESYSQLGNTTYLILDPSKTNLQTVSPGDFTYTLAYNGTGYQEQGKIDLTKIGRLNASDHLVVTML